MTSRKCLYSCQQGKCVGKTYLKSHHQVRDVLVETFKGEDVAHQKILVILGKETVMDLLMVD